jgi:thioredoxin-related protein
VRTEVANQRTIPLALPIVAAVLLIARVLWLQIPDRDADEPSLVHWTPISRAETLAASNRKPILFVFTATSSTACRQLDEQVFADKQLAGRINDSLVAVRVVDRSQEDGMSPAEVAALERRYGIELFPTVVVTDARGAERQRIEGFRGREAFVSLLTNASRKPVRR